MGHSIQIDKILGLEMQDVLAKKYNLWVGVSDSVWFHQGDNLECLVRWAADRVRDRLLVVIPGRLYATTIHHVEKRSRARALREGFEIENRFRARVEAFNLDGGEGRIKIANYDDCLAPIFCQRRDLLFREFSLEGDFYQRVTGIAADFLRLRGRTIDKTRVEAASLYQLQELPLFLGPVRIIQDETDTCYEANVYPGLGRFDELVCDLIDGQIFPELSLKLNVNEPSGIVGINKDQSL